MRWDILMSDQIVQHQTGKDLGVSIHTTTQVYIVPAHVSLVSVFKILCRTREARYLARYKCIGSSGNTLNAEEYIRSLTFNQNKTCDVFLSNFV